MIFLQVIAVGLVGFGIGVGMAVATGYAFQVVDLAFAMTWQIPLIGGAAILGCCLMAAMLSLVRVLKLEPSIVFRA
jgi:putative ABC transport system permease protein